jgi:hypothetical protein
LWDSHPSQEVSFYKHILMCWVSSPPMQPKHQSNASLMPLPKKITYLRWCGKVKVLVYPQYVFQICNILVHPYVKQKYQNKNLITTIVNQPFSWSKVGSILIFDLISSHLSFFSSKLLFANVNSYFFLRYPVSNRNIAWHSPNWLPMKISFLFSSTYETHFIQSSKSVELKSFPKIMLSLCSSIMRERGVLQVALQFNFWIAMTTCNSLYI